MLTALKDLYLFS